MIVRIIYFTVLILLHVDTNNPSVLRQTLNIRISDLRPIVQCLMVVTL